MADWITRTVETLGYFGIGFLMFLENLFPPIPSELIMPLAGFAASRPNSDIEFVPAVMVGVVGTVLGALPWYYAGMFLGEKRLMGLADRYGKWFTISSRDIEKAIAWFNQYGGAAVFLCRLVPGVRTLISLPAGLSRMNIGIFLLYSTLGTVIWTCLLASAGYLLGNNYALVEKYLGPVSKIVLLGLLVMFGIWVWQRRRQRLRSR